MATNKDLPTLKDVSRVPQELVPVIQWWQDHGKKTLTYVIVLAALVGGGYWIYARHHDNSIQAATELMISAGNETALQHVMDADTSVSPLAKLQLANSYYHSASNLSTALDLYNALIEECDDPALKDIATVGKIFTLSALEREDEALALIDQASATITASHYLYRDVLKAKAFILCKKGDKRGAKAVLEPLLAEVPEADVAKVAAKAEAEQWVRVIDAYTKTSSLTLPSLSALPTTQPALPVAPAETPAPAEGTPAPAPEEATPAEAAPTPEA